MNLLVAVIGFLGFAFASVLACSIMRFVSRRESYAYKVAKEPLREKATLPGSVAARLLVPMKDQEEFLELLREYHATVSHECAPRWVNWIVRWQVVRSAWPLTWARLTKELGASRPPHHVPIIVSLLLPLGYVVAGVISFGWDYAFVFDRTFTSWIDVGAVLESIGDLGSFMLVGAICTPLAPRAPIPWAVTSGVVFGLARLVFFRQWLSPDVSWPYGAMHGGAWYGIPVIGPFLGARLLLAYRNVRRSRRDGPISGIARA